MPTAPSPPELFFDWKDGSWLLYELRGSKGKIQPIKTYSGAYEEARDAAIAHAARYYRNGASLTITIRRPHRPRIQRTLHFPPW